MGITVLTEYFTSPNARRRKEILKSIELNCRIPQIREVVLFVEPAPLNLNHIDSLQHVLRPEYFDKIRIHEVSRRSTYSDFFKYANAHLDGRACVLCNNDISFDESLDEIENATDFDLDGHFICLTRWDVMKDCSLKFKEPVKVRKNSQDAWIFKPPLPAKMIEKGGFYMGRPGCDGMVAYLATISGLNLLNPSEIIKIKHLHLSRYKTYRWQHRLGGPDIYMSTFPTDKIQHNYLNVMYSFNEPSNDELRGREAINRAIEREVDNEAHWAWALKKCLR